MYGLKSIYVTVFLLLILALPFIMLMGGGKNRRVQQKFGLLFLFFVLYFFAAFRAETVGGDLEHYIPHFREICSVINFSDIFDLRSSNYEPGYTILCWLISRISNSVFVFLAITSFISLVGPFSLAKRYSVWPCVSILIYIMLGFYTNTYNNVRQSIAISIIFCSIPYLLSKKTIKFLLFVALAGSMHTSALVFVLAYLIRYIPISFKSFTVSLAAGYAVSTVSGIVIVQYLGSLFLSKYEELLGEGHGKTLMIIYIFITMCALFVYKKKQIIRNEEHTTLFIRFILAATIIQMFAIYFSSIVRLTYYFYIPIIVLLPNLLRTIRNVTTRRIVCVCIFFVLLYYMAAVYSYLPDTNSNSQGVIPYSLNI